MKYLKLSILLTALLALLTSCEEIIQIDLNESDPKIVIEGVITDQPGPYFVKITQTTDYYNPGTIPTISGAEVRISDNAGNEELLTEAESGIYQTQSLQGIPDRTYTLNVTYNGKSYHAESTMPVALTIDSLYSTKDNMGPRGEVHSIGCFFKDRPGVEDYGRFKLYSNGEAIPNYFLYNGRLSDGNVIDYKRFRQIEDLTSGDTVKVELFSIDRSVYEYYNTISDVLASDPRGMGSTEVPGNPITNLSGDALGYFGAFTVRSDSIVITE
jgi:hypothetical protein